MICISCGHENDEKFCPNCGEKRDTPKITFASTITSTIATITNMDKGFLYNLKNLTLNPKHTIEEYLKGKRKRIFNPISFLIIAITAYLVLESFFSIASIASEKQVNAVKGTLPYRIGSTGAAFIYNNFKFFWIFTVIPLSLITKLFFRRYNFAEHITINSFILGHLTLIVGSISFLIFRIPLIFNPFIFIALTWYIYRVFHQKNDKTGSFITAFASVLFFIITLFAIIVILGLINLI